MVVEKAVRLLAFQGLDQKPALFDGAVFWCADDQVVFHCDRVGSVDLGCNCTELIARPRRSPDDNEWRFESGTVKAPGFRCAADNFPGGNVARVDVTAPRASVRCAVRNYWAYRDVEAIRDRCTGL